METAVLLAGDLDIRPVVESLVRRGVFVEVWYEATSASAELHGAADYGMSLNVHALYQWGTEYFKAQHPLPTFSTDHAPVTGQLIKRGLHNRREVLLIKYPDAPGSVLRLESSDGVRWYEHADHKVLEKHVPLIHGPIDWE